MVKKVDKKYKDVYGNWIEGEEYKKSSKIERLSKSDTKNLRDMGKSINKKPVVQPPPKQQNKPTKPASKPKVQVSPITKKDEQRISKIRRLSKREQQLNQISNPRSEKQALSIDNATRFDFLRGRKIEGISVAEQNRLKKENPELYKKYVRYKEREKRKEARKSRVQRFWGKNVGEGSKIHGGAGKIKRAPGIAWRNKEKGYRYSLAGARKASRAAGEFGYALPGPFQVFTLAWKKTTMALKILTILALALAIFFVPWGVFYYTGWAVAAAFMFLVSAIYWVFISLFNGVASVMVTAINGLVRAMMFAVIWGVEAMTKFFVIDGTPMKTVNGVQVPPEYWTDGHALLENALIHYDQIANVPSLMVVVAPGWKSWMNETIIGKIIGWFGWDVNLSWLVSPFREVYSNLPAEQALVLGLLIIAIPIALLVVVYWRNRHHLYA